MMNPFKVLPILTLSVLMSCVACSTTKMAHESRTVTENQESSFEISYSLGNHGQHRLNGNSLGSGSPHVASFLEKEVIDEGAVRAESYRHFVAKVLTFTQNMQRTPSEARECRSPYSISLKIDGKTYTSRGCRIDDDGSFGKLVREGEFLLYSKK